MCSLKLLSANYPQCTKDDWKEEKVFPSEASSGARSEENFPGSARYELLTLTEIFRSGDGFPSYVGQVDYLEASLQHLQVHVPSHHIVPSSTQNGELQPDISSITASQVYTDSCRRSEGDCSAAPTVCFLTLVPENVS